MTAELLASWWAWIVTATLQASALLGAAWAIDRLLRRVVWSPLIACVWWLALARLALPLNVTSPWSVTTQLGATTLEAARTTPQSTALAALGLLWATGAAFVLLARAVRRCRMWNAVQLVDLPPVWKAALERAQRLTCVAKTPRVATLSGLRGAAVFGVLRTTLLLPADALDRAPSAADEHALLHELMHVRRRDLAKDELTALACALFWFNPLVWRAASRVHELSELACDRAVATALGRGAREYRQTLLEAASKWLAPTASAPREVRAFLGSRALILARLEQLDRPAATPALAVRGASALLTLFAAACVLPMAPSAPSLRAQALAVLAAEQRGELVSCFQLQAAARVLAAEPQVSPNSP